LDVPVEIPTLRSVIRVLVSIVICALTIVCHPATAAEPVPDRPPDWIQVHAPNLQSNIERTLRYHPDGEDFVIENGSEFFNRPLYCCNSAFRVDGGDKPQFSFYCPGRGGNLRLGVRTSAGAKWLDDARDIRTRYRPGSLLYEIRDNAFNNGVVNISVLPLADAKGIVLRAALTNATEPIEFVWAFGGANGQRGSRSGDIGCEREPVSQYFQLRPDECRGNVFTIQSDGFVLRGNNNIAIFGHTPPDSGLSIADGRNWASLGALMENARDTNEFPVLLGKVELKPGREVFLELGDVSEHGPADSNRADVAQIYSSAEEHRRSIAERVTVDTPDPFINCAMAAVNVAGDAIWDEEQGAYMHGAVAWRTKLLGWRGPYVADVLGWHDRARRHLSYWSGRQDTDPVPAEMPGPDPKVNLARNEPALHSNGDLSNSHYDMNLVYIDTLIRHFLWTGDVEFARQEWPVIERHMDWERRLFRRTFGPDNLPLYEAYAAIWASDNMGYNGGGVACTSAYNEFHNKMAAFIARLLIHEDPSPYVEEAVLIDRGMKKHLWLDDYGCLAESKDSLGLELAHPNAGLWAFYHSVDSEVLSTFEAWEMSRFVDTQIPHIPLRGKGIPSGVYYTLSTTSWMPYLWSLNNVVMAESAHTSLAYWQTGRPDEAFRLFKGCVLDSMYAGLCPGNLGMTTAFDVARREAQRDFGDAVGTVSRALIEGLFGVHPDALAGELRVQPGFPSNWIHASIHHPDFDFSFQRKSDGAKVNDDYVIAARFAKPMTIQLQVPAVRCEIGRITINGQASRSRSVDKSVGQPRIEIDCAAAPRQDIKIEWKGAEPALVKLRGQPRQEQSAPVVAKGEKLELDAGAALVQSVFDTEHVLTNLETRAHDLAGTTSGMFGLRTLFVKLQQGDAVWWSPVSLDIRPALEVVSDVAQDQTGLRFRVRNNTTRTIDDTAVLGAGDERLQQHVHVPAMGESEQLVIPGSRLLPGTQTVSVDWPGGLRAEGSVIDWKLHTSEPLEPIHLEAAFNDRVTQIFSNKYISPRSPLCSLAMPAQGLGGWSDYRESFVVDDSGLRAVAARNEGRFTLPEGVPFATPTSVGGKNVIFTSQWNNYPNDVLVPLNGKAHHIYFLMAGSSGPMQSRLDDGEVVIAYKDGSTERLALNNPVNWWPIDQDCFIDDFSFRRPEPIPPRVDLKTGKVRVLDPETFKGLGGPVPGGAATVLDLPLNPGKELKSLTVRALANEVVIGLMAATLAR
jgi:hypothetical protein